jgi:SAM-dependent methyltransferase
VTGESGVTGEAAAWVQRHAGLVPAGGVVLDVAAGGGRHTRWFLERGHPVVAVDRDLGGLRPLVGAEPRLEAVEADLEDGSPFPLAGRRFAGVVVVNYLHRPLLPALVAAVAPGGALLYETFLVGQERRGRPTDPAFLMRPGELPAAVAGHLEVVASEEGTLDGAEKQRIAAVRPI